MNWNVEYTNEFGTWWAVLTELQQENVAAVELLGEYGLVFLTVGEPWQSNKVRCRQGVLHLSV